jgi:hypothetical protein
MAEVTCARVNHGNTTFISGSYNFIISHAAAGLNHASCASIYHDI